MWPCWLWSNSLPRGDGQLCAPISNARQCPLPLEVFSVVITVHFSPEDLECCILEAGAQSVVIHGVKC